MGADTNAKDLAPEYSGLEAIAEGIRLIYSDGHEQLEHELPLYTYWLRKGRAGTNQSAARLQNESVRSGKAMRCRSLCHTKWKPLLTTIQNSLENYPGLRARNVYP